MKQVEHLMGSKPPYMVELAQGAPPKWNMPLGGGSVTTLASGQSSPYGIAVDSTSVYWTDFGSGLVMKATPK